MRPKRAAATNDTAESLPMAGATVDAVHALGRAAVFESDARTGAEFHERYWLVYEAARDELWRDPALANRSFSEVDSDVWGLLDDLTRSRQEYNDQESLDQRVEQFLRKLLRPTDQYDVAVEISSLMLPTVELALGPTTFTHFDWSWARKWGIRRKAETGAELIGRAVGIVRVSAGSFDKAWELATNEIDTSLAVLRTTMVESNAFAPVDELFLQQRGRRFVTRRLTGDRGRQSGMHRGFAPVTLDLRKRQAPQAGRIFAAASGMSATISPLYDNTYSASLTSALLRALEWIGSSITRDSYDDKVVDLCTAMECMLSTKSDGLKGQAIALRYMLLTERVSKNYVYYHAVLPVYEIRSQVIHGSRRRVASGQDYQLMREIAINTFRMAMQFLKQIDGVASIAKLVALLESDADRVEQVTWLLDQKFKPDQEVAKYAAKVLDRLKTVT
jgi:hypothetical protein